MTIENYWHVHVFTSSIARPWPDDILLFYIKAINNFQCKKMFFGSKKRTFVIFSNAIYLFLHILY